MDWGQSHLVALGVTFEQVAKKTKMSKDECECFYNQCRMNHLT
jgi:hypothetical protein